MAWNIRSTYYYLVCFATLLMVIIGTVQTVQTVVDLVLPREEAVTPMEIYNGYRQPAQVGEATPAPYTREELEQMAQEETERRHLAAWRSSLRSLIGNLALVFIALPVYVYHWRRVRRDDQM